MCDATDPLTPEVPYFTPGVGGFRLKAISTTGNVVFVETNTTSISARGDCAGELDPGDGDGDGDGDGSEPTTTTTSPTTTTTTVAPTPVAAPSGVAHITSSGGIETDRGESIAAGPDGSWYVTGRFAGTTTVADSNLVSAGDADAFVAAYNSDGTLRWVRRAGGPGSDGGNGIAVTSSGVFVTGSYQSSPGSGTNSFLAGLPASAGNSDVFVAALDPTTGTATWARRAGSTLADIGQGISATAGGVYATSQYRARPWDGTNSFLADLPASTISDGRFSGQDVFVAALDPTTGAPARTRRAGGASDDIAYGIAATTSGVYATGGYTSADPGLGTASFLAGLPASSGGEDVFVAALGP